LLPLNFFIISVPFGKVSFSSRMLLNLFVVLVSTLGVVTALFCTPGDAISAPTSLGDRYIDCNFAIASLVDVVGVTTLEV
jgi:hypothetical protein